MENCSPGNTNKRILSGIEADPLRQGMISGWSIQGGYWWPLSGPRPPHSEAFQDYYFQHEFGYTPLRRILADRGVTRVFEFREDGKAFEISIADLEPCYPGLEVFWTNEHFDWILYASHESSLTVGGEWLLPMVKELWPSWQRRVWTSPFYEKPMN